MQFGTPAPVIVKTWDSEKDLFEDLNDSDTLAYSEGVRNMDFDKNLGPYPIENFK